MASIIEGYTYDIFVSYRQKDNKYDGWVTEFVDNLKRELESMFKEEVSVYFDINPSDYLLESYDVDASLKDKLKCLIFIPIVSRTYCDPKSFAWDNELKAFVNEASGDQFGFKVKLPSGNVANRVLPIRIHDLDPADIKMFESVVGGVMRSIDFVYKETGVNRQLRAKDDEIIIRSPGQSLYRDQINKVALAIKEIIESLKAQTTSGKPVEKVVRAEEKEEKKEVKAEEAPGEKIASTAGKTMKDKNVPVQEMKFPKLKKSRLLIPGILIALIIMAGSIFLINRHSKVRWAEEVAIPEIERNYNELNLIQALNLVQKAEKYIPENPKLKEWDSLIIKKVTFLTDPPGADVYIREYSDMNGQWERIGTTPIDNMKMPRFTFYQVKFIKPGFDTVLAATMTSLDTLSRKLFETGKIPAGMVYIDGYWDEVKNTFEDQCGFFMDKLEVTNKQYKQFVDGGGYRKQDYWKNKFVKDGKTLEWDEAMAEFTDKTGRPGPSTWEAGDYPDGQDEYPVSGVSWYEAAAFAEYTGKELPTADHWDSGAGFFWNAIYENIGSRIYPLSNFNGKNSEPVGKNPGITAFGIYDMAGNVREWNWNQTNIGRIISGAGHNDATYQFTVWSHLPPFDRSPQNGFRCVKYIEKEKIPETAFRIVDMGMTGRTDYSKELPVAESVFKIYKSQFQYDSLPLNAVIEGKDESKNDWTVEKITFDAAYGNEKMVVYLYLPKNTHPPFQTLIFFPGSYAELETKFDINNSAVNWFFDYVLKSGRAVAYPVYKGTFERKEGHSPALHTHQYTEWLIKMVKDFSRSIDYLETRKDIDVTKLGFYGHSWGGILGGIIPAVEDRLMVNILIVGGFDPGGRAFPEADILNYVPRVKIPTIMLNGRYDINFPLETNLMPFYNLLGAPVKDKRICIYDTDHYVSKADMIKEVLGWCDKYMGPAK
jgi:hypothetical protein